LAAGPIRLDADPVTGNARARQNRQDLLQGIVRGPLVGSPGRPVDGDAAGRLAPPGLGEGQDLRSLGRGQAAAAGADEQRQRAVLFLDRDRMTGAVVDRNAAGRIARRGVAAGDRDGEARHEQAARGKPGAAAAGDR
jgi:hypothetical protein